MFQITLINIMLQAHLYLGLMLMCGFVLFDTQLIIEKRRMGSKDFVQHALELFIDFIGMFRRLLIILSQKVWIFKTPIQINFLCQPVGLSLLHIFYFYSEV